VLQKAGQSVDWGKSLICILFAVGMYHRPTALKACSREADDPPAAAAAVVVAV
jgi:hypothetical protein